jgi:SAM-dependent methyltransferase
MFGLGGAFTFGECEGCGALHLLNPPADLSPYYPKTYYSFQATLASPLPTGLRGELWRWRNRGQLTGRGVAGTVAKARPRPEIARIMCELRAYGIESLETRILDVGCGNGGWLFEARQAGFTHLHGCDPFAEPLHHPPVQVFASDISEMTGPYDLIRLSHALEHMPDQFAPMHAIARLLAPGGRCVIAIPVAQSLAQEEYGADLMPLEPPRHFVLHTPQSLGRVARETGLRVVSATHELTPNDFWQSELVRRGMTLTAPDGHQWTAEEIFTSDEIATFNAKAAEAQQAGRSAQMRFVLAPAGE